jgi:DNA-3-methyladenine glycosylase
LAIDKSFNGWDVTIRKSLWLESHKLISTASINSGPRIGIDYAVPEDRDALWRFWI